MLIFNQALRTREAHILHLIYLAQGSAPQKDGSRPNPVVTAAATGGLTLKNTYSCGLAWPLL